MVGIRIRQEFSETVSASSSHTMSTPSIDFIFFTLWRIPENMNSLPLLQRMALSVVRKWSSYPMASIWSHRSLCTESLIEFCSSRPHRIRSWRLAARTRSARATAHDLPAPRPPWNTLYRWGRNRGANFSANSTLVVRFDKHDLRSEWAGVGSVRNLLPCEFLGLPVGPCLKLGPCLHEPDNSGGGQR